MQRPEIGAIDLVEAPELRQDIIQTPELIVLMDLHLIELVGRTEVVARLEVLLAILVVGARGPIKVELHLEPIAGPVVELEALAPTEVVVAQEAVEAIEVLQEVAEATEVQDLVEVHAAATEALVEVVLHQEDLQAEEAALEEDNSGTHTLSTN